MIRRVLAGGLGLIAFGVGLLAVVDPTVVVVSLPTVSVAVAGIVLLLLAYRVLVGRYRRPRFLARTGDPERAAVSAQPGEDVSKTVSGFLHSEYVPTRRGLRAVAVAVLVHYTGASEERARKMLTERSWSENPYALAYFTDDATAGLSLLTRLRDRLRPESDYRQQQRHAVDAVSAIAGVVAPPGPTVLEQWTERLGALGTRDDETKDGRVAIEPMTAADDPGPTTETPGDREQTFERAEGSTSPRETGHLRGVSVVVLVAAGVGALAREPTLLLAGVLGIGLAAYASAASPPDPTLTITRSLDHEDPDPGERVTVTVTVTNRGERTLSDLRLIDGVPAACPVVEDTPRCGAVLQSGEAVTFSYVVEGRRGEHQFDALLAIAHDRAGVYETVSHLDADTMVRCRPQFSGGEALSPGHLAAAGPGGVPTAAGGDGVEFHAVREYRRGDPRRRIDWKRRARTGEFATLEFREERATRVVCLLDARAPAYVTHHPEAPHALDRSVTAAGEIATTLLDAGNRVGVAALGPTDCWLAPATGRLQRSRLRELLVTHDALDQAPPTEAVDPDVQLTALRRRLHDDTAIVLFSPLVDEQAVATARQLDAEGYSVSVLSPDPTAVDAAPQRLARAVRTLRIGRLRRAHVPVVDVGADEPLAAALTRDLPRGQS